MLDYFVEILSRLRRMERTFPVGNLSDVLMVTLGCFFAIWFTACRSAEPVEPDVEFVSAPFFSDYPDPETTLSALVREMNDRDVNHFCILGYRYANRHHAWVHWVEGNAMILWEGENNLLWSRRFLDLKRDVVPAREDIGSSTYLVDQSWVDRVVNDCKKHGTSYVISK